MKQLLILTCVLMVAALGGCSANKSMGIVSTDHARNSLLSPEQARQLEQQITDKDIANVLDAKIKPKLPTAIAIARLDDAGYSATLTPLGKAELRAWETALVRQPQIQGIRTISAVGSDSRDISLHSLRSLAAGMGCELVLVYMVANGEVDNYNNAAVLYWTFVGLFLVPGNDLEHKTVMQAVLVDCRTGVILGTANGEGLAKESYVPSAAGIVKDRLRATTPQKALEDLQKNTTVMVRQVTRNHE